MSYVHTHKHVLSSTPRSSRLSYIDHVHTNTSLSTAGHAAVLVTWWPPRLTGRSPLAADRARQATDHDRRPTFVRSRRTHRSRRCCSAVQIAKVLSRWLRRQHDKAAKTWHLPAQTMRRCEVSTYRPQHRPCPCLSISPVIHVQPYYKSTHTNKFLHYTIHNFRYDEVDLIVTPTPG